MSAQDQETKSVVGGLPNPTLSNNSPVAIQFTSTLQRSTLPADSVSPMTQNTPILLLGTDEVRICECTYEECVCLPVADCQVLRDWRDFKATPAYKRYGFHIAQVLHFSKVDDNICWLKNEEDLDTFNSQFATYQAKVGTLAQRIGEYDGHRNIIDSQYNLEILKRSPRKIPPTVMNVYFSTFNRLRSDILVLNQELDQLAAGLCAFLVSDLPRGANIRRWFRKKLASQNFVKLNTPLRAEISFLVFYCMIPFFMPYTAILSVLHYTTLFPIAALYSKFYNTEPARLGRRFFCLMSLPFFYIKRKTRSGLIAVTNFVYDFGWRTFVKPLYLFPTAVAFCIAAVLVVRVLRRPINHSKGFAGDIDRKKNALIQIAIAFASLFAVGSFAWWKNMVTYMSFFNLFNIAFGDFSGCRSPECSSNKDSKPPANVTTLCFACAGKATTKHAMVALPGLTVDTNNLSAILADVPVYSRQLVITLLESLKDQPVDTKPSIPDWFKKLPSVVQAALVPMPVDEFLKGDFKIEYHLVTKSWRIAPLKKPFFDNSVMSSDEAKTSDSDSSLQRTMRTYRATKPPIKNTKMTRAHAAVLEALAHNSSLPTVALNPNVELKTSDDEAGCISIEDNLMSSSWPPMDPGCYPIAQPVLDQDDESAEAVRLIDRLLEQFGPAWRWIRRFSLGLAGLLLLYFAYWWFDNKKICKHKFDCKYAVNGLCNTKCGCDLHHPECVPVPLDEAGKTVLRTPAIERICNRTHCVDPGCPYRHPANESAATSTKVDLNKAAVQVLAATTVVKSCPIDETGRNDLTKLAATPDHCPMGSRCKRNPCSRIHTVDNVYSRDMPYNEGATLSERDKAYEVVKREIWRQVDETVHGCTHVCDLKDIEGNEVFQIDWRHNCNIDCGDPKCIHWSGCRCVKIPLEQLICVNFPSCANCTHAKLGSNDLTEWLSTMSNLKIVLDKATNQLKSHLQIDEGKRERHAQARNAKAQMRVAMDLGQSIADIKRAKSLKRANWEAERKRAEQEINMAVEDRKKVTIHWIGYSLQDIENQIASGHISLAKWSDEKNGWVYEVKKPKNIAELHQIMRKEGLRLAPERLNYQDFRINFTTGRALIPTVQRALRAIAARDPISAAQHNLIFEMVQDGSISGDLRAFNAILRDYVNLSEVELGGTYTFDPSYKTGNALFGMRDVQDQPLSMPVNQRDIIRSWADTVDTVVSDIQDALNHTRQTPKELLFNFSELLNPIRVGDSDSSHWNKVDIDHMLVRLYERYHDSDVFGKVADEFFRCRGPHHSPEMWKTSREFVNYIENYFSGTANESADKDTAMVFAFPEFKSAALKLAPDIRNEVKLKGRIPIDKLYKRIYAEANRATHSRDEANISGVQWKVDTSGVFSIFAQSNNIPLQWWGTCSITNNSKFVTSSHVFNTLQSGQYLPEDVRFWVVEGQRSGEHIMRAVDNSTIQHHPVKDVAKFAVKSVPFRLTVKEVEGKSRFCIDTFPDPHTIPTWFMKNRHYTTAIPKEGDPIRKITPIWDETLFKGIITDTGKVGQFDGPNFLHNIDSNHCHSGSPLLNAQGKIVGVHKGVYSVARSNQAAAVDMVLVAIINGDQNMDAVLKSKNSQPTLPK